MVFTNAGIPFVFVHSTFKSWIFPFLCFAKKRSNFLCVCLPACLRELRRVDAARVQRACSRLLSPPSAKTVSVLLGVGYFEGCGQKLDVRFLFVVRWHVMVYPMKRGVSFFVFRSLFLLCSDRAYQCSLPEKVVKRVYLSIHLYIYLFMYLFISATEWLRAACGHRGHRDFAMRVLRR